MDYGTNAYVAAINIVLRRDASGALDAYGGAGTESLLTAGAHDTAGIGAAQLFVSANSRRDDGRERTVLDERGKLGSYREYERGDDVTLQVRSKHHTPLVNAVSDTDSFLGNTPDLASGLGQNARSNGLLATYELAVPVSAVDLLYRATYDRSNRNFSRSASGLTRSNVEGWRFANSVAVGLNVAPSLTIEGGADHETRRSVEYTNYDVPTGRVLENNGMRGRSLSDGSTFGRATYDHDAWRWSGGVRYSKSQVVGSNLSGDARAEYKFRSGDRIAIEAGQSYRPPSLFELYFQTSTNTVYGNLALLPERSTSYEIVYLHSAGAFETQATLYHATYVDKIFRTRRFPNNPGDLSLIYINGTPFVANGLELEARSSFHGATIFGTYTFVDGSRGDAAPGSNHYNFRYVPQHALNAGAAHAIGSWSLAAIGTWRSSTHGPLADIPARSSFDLNLGYATQIARMTVHHSLVVSNAFDARDDVPEFVRRNINAIPSGVGRRVEYVVGLSRK